MGFLLPLKYRLNLLASYEGWFFYLKYCNDVGPRCLNYFSFCSTYISSFAGCRPSDVWQINPVINKTWYLESVLKIEKLPTQIWGKRIYYLARSSTLPSANININKLFKCRGILSKRHGLLRRSGLGIALRESEKKKMIKIGRKKIKGEQNWVKETKKRKTQRERTKKLKSKY